MARCINIQKNPQRTLLVGQLADLPKTKLKIILRLFRGQSRVCEQCQLAVTEELQARGSVTEEE